jgi:hypothetical protein
MDKQIDMYFLLVNLIIGKDLELVAYVTKNI